MEFLILSMCHIKSIGTHYRHPKYSGYMFYFVCKRLYTELVLRIFAILRTRNEHSMNVHKFVALEEKEESLNTRWILDL